MLRLGGCALRARAAPPLGGLIAGASTAAARSLASSSSSYVSPADTREGRRRKAGFWSKWGELSQQEFWQEVGFDHDRAMDTRRSGVAGKSKKKGAPSGERADFREMRKGRPEDDEYFDAEDAALMAAARGGADALGEGLGVDAAAALEAGEFFLDGDDGDELAAALRGAFAVPSPGSRAGEERAARARQALLADGAIAPSRRVELLELLEDLGPEGLQAPPKMPREDARCERERARAARHPRG